MYAGGRGPLRNDLDVRLQSRTLRGLCRGVHNQTRHPRKLGGIMRGDRSAERERGCGKYRRDAFWHDHLAPAFLC